MCFVALAGPMSAGVRAKEKVQAKELRDRMEAQIAPAARELEKILVQIPSQTDSPRQELLLSRTGRRPAGQQRLQTFAVCLRRSESNTPPNH